MHTKSHHASFLFGLDGPGGHSSRRGGRGFTTNRGLEHHVSIAEDGPTGGHDMPPGRRHVHGEREHHGRGGHGRGGQRVLGRGELPLVILALLADAPRHGYEVIRCIEERCRGGYSPSAGVVYPTLTMLVEQELALADPTSDSGKRRYVITEAGRRHAIENDGLIKGAFARMDMVARIRSREALPPRVAQAMETLKQALLAPGHWNDAESERVAAEIERAAIVIIDSPLPKEPSSS